MVHVNANLDLKTEAVFKTGKFGALVSDLCESPLYITFIARNKPFENDAWQKNGESFMDIVLPYDDVLTTEDIDLLMARELYRQAEKLAWLDYGRMREELRRLFVLN